MSKLRMSLLPACILLLAGCMGPERLHRLDVAKVKHPETEEIIGLTTIRGEDVRFDPPGAVYAAGAIRGTVQKAAYTARVEEVQRLWVMRRNISKARTATLVGVVAVAAVAAVAIAAVATFGSGGGGFGGGGGGMSCPFVYSWDGSQYTFDAEVFTGSLTRGMELDDYSELAHIREQNGVYRVLEANELDETEHTDLVELWTVDHPAGTRVVTDEFGKVYTLAHPQPPLAARDEAGADLLPWLETTDRRIWEALPATNPEGRVRHDIVMTFPKPVDAGTVKLISNASTGTWATEMVKVLFGLYGTEINNRLAALDRDPADVKALVDWATREDVYRLRVWVEEPDGWQVRGVIPWSALRLTEDRVVPLDISRVRGDRLCIRIQPPAGFWALNSFAVDYSAEQPVSVTRVPVKDARRSTGEDVSRSLRATDGDYYTAHTGDQAEITFAAPPERHGLLRSVILHSRGYYRLNLHPSTPPDAEALRGIFETPDGLARLAARRYAALAGTN